MRTYRFADERPDTDKTQTRRVGLMEITKTAWTTEGFGALAMHAPAGTLLAPCAGSVDGTTVSVEGTAVAVAGGFATDRTRVVGPRGGYTPFIHKSIDVADPPHGLPPV